MAVRLATRAEALRNPTQHTYVPKVGYLKLETPLKNGGHPTNRAHPPSINVGDGTWHKLQPPGGAKPISFQYMATIRAWYRLDRQAKRIAFTPEYLSSWGWSYLGPQ